MKANYSLVVYVLFGALATGCVTPVPVPKMEHQEASGIAISVKIKRPLGWPTDDAQQVYFIKVDGNAGIHSSTVIQSNFEKDGMVYLLNADPGDYSAVAAWHVGTAAPTAPTLPGFSITFNPAAMGFTTYFPKDIVELTRVSVEKGQIACAGTYVLSTSVFGDRDPTQSHYQSVISRGISWRGKHNDAKNDANTKSECLKKVKEDLADSEWPAVIK